MPTKIEWAHESWNPITGCTKISEGCRHCYAERMAKRLAGRHGYPESPCHFDVTLHPDKLLQPLHWRKPRRIFVCSMGDLFHEEVEWSDISDIWNVMRQAIQHTFLILTKRPQQMFDYIMDYWLYYGCDTLSNVWLGVTAENQRCADERIPILLKTPSVARFVSVEPILGSIGLRQDWLEPDAFNLDPITLIGECNQYAPSLDWVICGEETGPDAHSMDVDWALSLHRQSQAAGIPFFFKRRKRGFPIPDDLMIREYPNNL